MTRPAHSCRNVESPGGGAAKPVPTVRRCRSLRPTTAVASLRLVGLDVHAKTTAMANTAAIDTLAVPQHAPTGAFAALRGVQPPTATTLG